MAKENNDGFKILPISFRANAKDCTMDYFDSLPGRLYLKRKVKVKASTVAKSLLFYFMRWTKEKQKEYLTNKKLYPGKFPAKS